MIRIWHPVPSFTGWTSTCPIIKKFHSKNGPVLKAGSLDFILILSENIQIGLIDFVFNWAGLILSQLFTYFCIEFESKFSILLSRLYENALKSHVIVFAYLLILFITFKR